MCFGDSGTSLSARCFEIRLHLNDNVSENLDTGNGFGGGVVVVGGKETNVMNI